ncbi:hypothetical protein GCM10011490_13970 [Pseudoclavibacter endophyticus]|uniref:Uncharacterized protein n=1 Tax=Pseudoclavibacter endophyticus TaxID=1778590 RepID=A0A6H9WQZ7_9MICO|nr:hypothetical protein [Pseudoclavibacter endophyticus]KAB1649205.1 hypothetical protein F8O04_02695 [Pseudoclavibacter endophyticus]GGA64538.1 hypothetical protein GCM10011490_13970 [Pseudoclavibacter endophyticus]
MRKFITNGAVLSSVFAIVPLLRQTATQRRKWKVALMWLAWGVGVAVAVASVLDDIDEAREAELEND